MCVARVACVARVGALLAFVALKKVRCHCRWDAGKLGGQEAISKQTAHGARESESVRSIESVGSRAESINNREL